MEDQIIIYQPKDGAIVIEVKVEEETVWLSQAQMAGLFETTKQNISLHINNCFREGELSASSVVKDSLTTASDGKKYKLKYYNLDVIISVGYRVKSTIQPELILEDIPLFGPINLGEKTADEFGSYKKELP